MHCISSQRLPHCKALGACRALTRADFSDQSSQPASTLWSKRYLQSFIHSRIYLHPTHVLPQQPGKGSLSFGMSLTKQCTPTPERPHGVVPGTQGTNCQAGGDAGDAATPMTERCFSFWRKGTKGDLGGSFGKRRKLTHPFRTLLPEPLRAKL